MPRGRFTVSGKKKASKEAQDGEVAGRSGATNGRHAASLPRNFDAEVDGERRPEQRRSSLRSIGRTLSSLFSSTKNNPQQQQQIQVLLEQQQHQQQQFQQYLEHQEQQQQQILSFLEQQQQRQTQPQPQPLSFLEQQQQQQQQQPSQEEIIPHEQPLQDQHERQQLQECLMQQKQQLQELALKVSNANEPQDLSQLQPQPPRLQYQHSLPLQHPQPPQRRIQHQQSLDQSRRDLPQAQPQSPKLHYQHSLQFPQPPQRRIPYQQSLDQPRAGISRPTPPTPPQRQFSTDSSGDGRSSRPRAHEAPTAVRLRRSRNSDSRPQSCSRVSQRSDFSSASGPSAARSFSNIKGDNEGLNDGPRIRYSSTFIRKSVGEDLCGSGSPGSDSAFFVCDILDGNEEPDTNVSHFVTLRKSKRKGPHRQSSTVERKEAYTKEKPTPRPPSTSLSSSSGTLTRHQKKAPTAMIDNL